MSDTLDNIQAMKKKMYECIEGIYSGACKNLTVLRLEEAFELLQKIEKAVKDKD